MKLAAIALAALGFVAFAAAPAAAQGCNWSQQSKTTTDSGQTS